LTLEGLRELIDAADREPHRFPPTLIYSEGWMLRLVLHWFQTHEAPGHILEFQPGATWFSEALLPSPFRPRHRGDARSEARTHADGVVGHFTIGSAAKADARLLPEASQLVITEAKMHSPLSAGTRNAPMYDQAARNVACMSELLSRANVQPSQIRPLAFLVLAPQEHVNEGTIREKLTKASIEMAVRLRAQAFSGELDPWLETWFIPTLQSIRLEAIPWERLLADIANNDNAAHQELMAFYQRCLQYNTSRFVPD
jgi:hypothetical protein